MRYEYKYIVPLFQLDYLRSMLQPFVEMDSFAKETGGAYTVKSIYFDTPTMQMYHSKINHLANRMKVRIRGYNERRADSVVFLEIKRKYEGPIVKNRSKVPFEFLLQYDKTRDYSLLEQDSLNTENFARFFFQIYSKNLSPVVNVIYEREPFHSKVKDYSNDCRITFDKNLRSVYLPKIQDLFDDTNSRMVDNETFILELKFNQYCPIWMKPILSELKLQKVPASKYVLCVENHQKRDSNVNLHRFNYLNL